MGLGPFEVGTSQLEHPAQGSCRHQPARVGGCNFAGVILLVLSAMCSWVLHKLWPEWHSSDWFLLQPCKAKPPLLAAECGFCICGLSVQGDSEVGLVLSQEFPNHPNMSNPQHRKGKVCLQARKKMSLVSGKKPSPLISFQGKNLCSSHSLWKKCECSQTHLKVQSSHCFAVSWSCSSAGITPVNWGLAPSHSQLPHHRTSLGTCLRMQLCRWCLHGLDWAAPLPLPRWVRLVTSGCQSQLMKMVLKFGLADTDGDKLRG